MTSLPIDALSARLRRCCSGGHWETQWEYVYHPYVQPQPFSSLPAGAAWRPPELGRPAWCDKLTGINVEFGTLANHPCAYWTDDYGPKTKQALGA